jgi:hypothetical protein
MSNIVAFSPERRKRRATPEQGAFQLLFFTGVRYERQEPVATTRKRRRNVRAKDADKRSA